MGHDLQRTSQTGKIVRPLPLHQKTIRAVRYDVDERRHADTTPEQVREHCWIPQHRPLCRSLRMWRLPVEKYSVQVTQSQDLE